MSDEPVRQRARANTTCGTYGGYQRHKRQGTQPCWSCIEANRAYTAQWRANPERREREKRRENARKRALWRLAQEYPARFRQLVAEEMP